MLLDDGETFSDAHGCRVISVPEDWGIDDVQDRAWCFGATAMRIIEDGHR